MIWKLTFLFFVVSVMAGTLNGQANVQNEKLFIEYLLRSNNFDEAVFAIDQLNIDRYGPELRDTFNYFKGIGYFSLQQLEDAFHSFIKVKDVPLYQPAQFLAFYSLLHKYDYLKAEGVMAGFDPGQEVFEEFKAFQLSGLYLLRRDTQLYRKTAKMFKYNHFAFSKEEKVLDGIYQDLLEHKEKSYFWAGFMSAILPGSGKIYVGKLGEGLYALLANAVLAAITYENYTKAGPGNIKTIAAGAAFTTFYVGNIYGSVASVKQYRQDFNHEMDHRILFNLHVPLRTMFLQ